MLKSLLLLTAVSAWIASNAQSTDIASASVHYDFTHITDSTQPDNPNKDETVLYLGKKSSLYTSYSNIQSEIRVKDFLLKHPDAKISGSTVYYGAPITFYKDMEHEGLESIAYFQGNIYLVEEKTPLIEWKILPDTKTIHEYPCQKATASFRGRSYEAWFCSQLPYNNGPWKLGGLPGLILEAYDTQKEVVFSFKYFDNGDTSATPIKIPANTIKSSQKDLDKAVFASQNDSGKPAGVSGGGGMIAQSSANGAPVKRRHYNNPIEKNETANK